MTTLPDDLRQQADELRRMGVATGFADKLDEAATVIDAQAAKLAQADTEKADLRAIITRHLEVIAKLSGEPHG